MDDVSNLISQVEQAQKQNYQNGLNSANTNRTIAHDRLATQANSSGLLFSNYAPTKQIQYDSSTYLPTVNTAQTNYLTTMDKIIANGRTYYDKINKYNEAINELNNS